jgi:hypothetical protein
MKRYTVTVGDVCFVITGMICNRPYQAVRYQPTTCVLITSPVRSSDIAEAVRGIWSASDPRAKLLGSLREDLASTNTPDLLQPGAAMRLLYYYPRQGADAVLERLSKLDARPNETPSERLKRHGISAAGFVRSIAWTSDPTIQAAVRKLSDEWRDPDMTEAAMPCFIAKP